MPNYTTNYNLVKPLDSELYDIEVQNENMDKIDEALANGGNAVNYSEVEEATGGTWFDGKPIYRISKYYSGVTFAGTGQWTIIGEAPIDLFSTAYNIIDSNVRLMIGGFSSAQSNCIGVDLPIVYNGGILSTTWATDDNKLTFNWANSVTAPFTTTNVLVTVYYTKNE